jgi:HD-like signal output (HDOD) protein
MIPAIRTGFASTLHSLVAWWRARGPVRPSATPGPRLASRGGNAGSARPEPAAHCDVPLHGEHALRLFTLFALDERRTALPGDDEMAALEPLVRAGSAAIAKLEVQARYLPRRPSLLPKLLSAMNSDANSMRDLARIIGGDPTLLGNLLRVANSVFYRGTAKPVQSLERAVTLVGTDGIRSVIATSLVHPVMASGSGWFAKFPETVWEQTQYAADAAEAHALSVERADGFNARLLALLHGLAVNTVFRIVRDEVLPGRDEAAKPAVARLLEEWVVPVARQIAASWDLPPDLQAVLTASREQEPLARSLFFGRLAGAQLVLVKRGRLKEASARAILLASDSRRAQIDRLWSRLAVVCRP